MENECRIYLSSNDETIFAVVSPEDYAWAQQWKWSYTWDRHKRKMYATRTTRTKERPRAYKIYLHKAILSERMESVPPSDKHTIGDHGDSDSLNNRRDNLEWVTPRMNADRKRSKRWRHLPPANDNQPQEQAA